jgi:hypothetical protein
LQSIIPEHSGLAIFLDPDDAEIHLFGDHLDRVVIPLALDRGVAHAADWRFSYLLTHQPDGLVAQVQTGVPWCRHEVWSGTRNKSTPWRLYRCGAAPSTKPS